MSSERSRLTDHDLYLFGEGTLYAVHDVLGAHPGQRDGVDGTWFAVWAPNAVAVAVIGSFNDWRGDRDRLVPRGDSGIWEGFVPGVGSGALYKYRIESRHQGHVADKADPVGFWHEVPPAKASIVWELDYEWGDTEWMAERVSRMPRDRPVSVYELHLGSWRRGEHGRFLSYRELAPQLAGHLEHLGFTHVELMPVMEHPFYGSWGYQVCGYFAPTARYGEPQDLMYLIDYLHQRGIGVILDWVPAHFPTDAHGLGYFDGTHLYEHADPRKGFHPDWTSFIYNYGRDEVRSFLISNALFWLQRYHVDGIRIDGVASMLYLDYSREPGQWVPNEDGSNENRDAVAFVQQLNEAVYKHCPGAETIAEESTAWPAVSRPTSDGGLGFGYKWDMGWMHDTLQFLSRDPVHRKFHHNEITFRAIYTYNENYMLPLSHDEVVHGKGSLLSRMPGDDWQRFANLRLLLGYMFGQPGKKLLFMGTELAPNHEWNHDVSLDWGLQLDPRRGALARWLRDLNLTYRAHSALFEGDVEPFGFEWIEGADGENSALSFLRLARDGSAPFAVVCNFTPVPRTGYRLGLPHAGRWDELLNSDADIYSGSGICNGTVIATDEPWHYRPCSAEVQLPPLGCVFLRYEGGS